MGDFNAYNNSFKDFDKSFNRTKRFVWFILIMQILFVILCFVGIVWGSIWGIQKINQYGLKGCVDRVWVGKDYKDYNFTNPPPGAVKSNERL